jgi:hypothetical protein
MFEEYFFFGPLHRPQTPCEVPVESLALRTECYARPALEKSRGKGV